MILPFASSAGRHFFRTCLFGPSKLWKQAEKDGPSFCLRSFHIAPHIPTIAVILRPLAVMSAESEGVLQPEAVYSESKYRQDVKYTSNLN